jgi:hypothetical protein
MSDPQAKPRRGCLFYAIVTVVVLAGVVLFGAYLGLRYAKKLVSQLTDTHPMTLPTVHLSDQQMFQLHDRVNSFSDDIRDGENVAPLALSSDEVNALIQTDTGLAPLKDHVYVTFGTNELKGQISFLAQDLGLESPPLHDRYVNASGVFSVGLTNNQLVITAESLDVKGKPVPRHIMKQVGAQNLAGKFDQDPRTAAGLKKLQAIEIKDGKLLIVPKKP